MPEPETSTSQSQPAADKEIRGPQPHRCNDRVEDVIQARKSLPEFLNVLGADRTQLQRHYSSRQTTGQNLCPPGALCGGVLAQRKGALCEEPVCASNAINRGTGLCQQRNQCRPCALQARAAGPILFRHTAGTREPCQHSAVEKIALRVQV